MPKTSQQNEYGKVIISWKVHEYEPHERSKTWYIMASLIAFLLLLFCFFTANFLFAVIIIIIAIVIITHDGQEPELVKIAITNEGLVVGKRFYDYDEFKNFSIVYKPKQGVKNLYFEFKSAVRPRISIALKDKNPLIIKKHLQKYLDEDLERTDETFSESIARMFKL